MLRLEDMLAKMQYFASQSHEYQHHTALLTMFQILELLDRSDLKTDLLQELDRQRLVMGNLRNNTEIEQDALEQIIGEIEQIALSLRTIGSRLGQPLRENEWLMSVKQRAVIPGGVGAFDVPSYHYWLGLPTESRQLDLEHWFTPLQAMQDALNVVLRILRGSGEEVEYTAHSGSYQKMLGGGKPAQMIRVTLNDNSVCFPEISANKYAIGIRFSSLGGAQKPRPCDFDVDFKLSLCNL